MQTWLRFRPSGEQVAPRDARSRAPPPDDEGHPGGTLIIAFIEPGKNKIASARKPGISTGISSMQFSIIYALTRKKTGCPLRSSPLFDFDQKFIRTRYRQP